MHTQAGILDLQANTNVMSQNTSQSQNGRPAKRAARERISASSQPRRKRRNHGTPTTQTPDTQHLTIHQNHQDVTTTTVHVNPLFRDDSEDLNTSPTQPLPPNKRSRTRYLSQDTNLPTAIPALLPESSSGQERANLVWHNKRNKAQSTQPITAITSIYKHELNYKLIDRHKLFKPHRREGSNDSPQTYQKQYHTHWAPMTIEKWAIPIFTAAGFKKVCAIATKRSEIHCACCEICFEWEGMESRAEPFEDEYVCDV